jgi:hypothetical protein
LAEARRFQQLNTVIQPSSNLRSSKNEASMMNFAEFYDGLWVFLEAGIRQNMTTSRSPNCRRWYTKSSNGRLYLQPNRLLLKSN